MNCTKKGNVCVHFPKKVDSSSLAQELASTLAQESALVVAVSEITCLLIL